MKRRQARKSLHNAKAKMCINNELTGSKHTANSNWILIQIFVCAVVSVPAYIIFFGLCGEQASFIRIISIEMQFLVY